MRYIECGVQDKNNAYFFDSSLFDFYSYFIYFDNSAQWADLAGAIDQSDITFDYVNQDYISEFASNISPLSTQMFTQFKNFDGTEDFTVSSEYDSSNSVLTNNIMRFVDEIDMFNRQVTSRDFYEHGITNIFPFAEFIVIKPRGSKYIINVLLNKFITKIIVPPAINYSLSNESLMSKYLYHYSTYESDYTSLYLQLLYNLKDNETINKSTMVFSNILFPLIFNDSSRLYFNISIDYTTSDSTSSYSFFDLSESQFIYLNNKYLCQVSDVESLSVDTTQSDRTVITTYRIEFLDFDTTDVLQNYMGATIYNDFTKYLYEYFINIRVIKKLDYQNVFFMNDSESSFFKMKFSIKTFFGYQNRSQDTPLSDQKSYFTNSAVSNQITYSGIYDVTNESRLNLLPLLNSFSSDQYVVPYDITIPKECIIDSTPFTIDLFIANSSDITNFLGNLMLNGIYIYNEHNVQDTMILRLVKFNQKDSNTFQLTFIAISYDDVWAGDISSYYVVPSSSYLIQYKYHIYGVLPYVMLDKFTYNNDINNLITIHSFAYTSYNPSTLQQNGNIINV